MRISQSRVGMVFIQTLLETTNLDVLLNRLLSRRVAEKQKSSLIAHEQRTSPQALGINCHSRDFVQRLSALYTI